MVLHSKGRLLAGAFFIAAVWLCGVSYGWTCAGSENETNSGGNYPLGCPMGGIGGGNFNLLPGGDYNTLFCLEVADKGAMPTCAAFGKRGATAASATLQNGSGGVTTTYTAYWPTVTLQYAGTGINDALSLKCFSPIIAGDGVASGNENASLPVAIFKFTFTNSSTSYDTAGIMLGNQSTSQVSVGGSVVGMSTGTSCLMVDTAKSDPADVITCGSANTGFSTSGQLGNSGAGFLAKRVVVAPNSTRAITFCVAWTNITAGYYRNYFTSAQTMATYGRDNAASLEAKVDNWHNKILNSNLPSWLTDLAINCCHVYNSMTSWTTATSNGISGTYGMEESMSSIGNFGTNDQAYHAHFALACFAPQAEWSQVARMTSSQLSSGLFGHTYGSTDNRSDCGQKFMLETYKIYQWTGTTANLNTLYPAIKKGIAGVITEDNNGDGLTDDNFQTTYDNPFSSGWSFPSKEYDNELYLAALKAAINAAQATGNSGDVAAYNADFTKTSAGFERDNNATIANSGFWNTSCASSSGKTGYYTGSSNISPSASTPSKGTCVWDAALMGQWCADVCGLGPLHPESRIESTLDVINDACVDQHNPPCYTMMMAYPNVNNTGATPTSTYFSGPYVSYASYGPGELIGAFYHNKPDLAMRAVHSFWNQTMGKFLRVFNVPCKMTLSGAASTDWGADRYMNPPAVFAALYGISGFSIDVNAKILRIKPSLPTSTQYKLVGDSLKAAPLINPISCGTVDYRNFASSNYQRFFVKFDNPMTFNTFYCGKEGSTLKVAVTKSGTTVSPTIAVNTADTSEYMVSFGGSGLSFDNTGVSIYIGNYNGSSVNAPARAIKVQDFLVNMKLGKISYSLPEGSSVKICLVNSQGSERTLFHGQQAAGNHTLGHNWKNEPLGVYYVTLTAGDSKTVKRLVRVQ
jgi:uncharacterized protein (DUF608 family)